MSLSQAFLLELARIGDDRPRLIEWMSTLDAKKTAARNTLRMISNRPAEEGGLAGPARERKLRALRTQIECRKVEREAIKNKIAAIKRQEKQLQRITNSTSPTFQAAFMAAAEQLLDEKTFLTIESKAAALMSRKDRD